MPAGAQQSSQHIGHPGSTLPQWLQYGFMGCQAVGLPPPSTPLILGCRSCLHLSHALPLPRLPWEEISCCLPPLLPSACSGHWLPIRPFGSHPRADLHSPTLRVCTDTYICSHMDSTHIHTHVHTFQDWAVLLIYKRK